MATFAILISMPARCSPLVPADLLQASLSA